MNYRQWKKNYKKVHGYNPPLADDKRKKAKQAAMTIVEFVKLFSENLAKVCDGISQAFNILAENLRR